MVHDLKPVSEFVKSGPFTEHQVRWWVFNAEQNGLKEHRGVVRVGRRVYINVPAFERWIEAQQQPKRGAP